jgi:Transposase DDE domain/Insertion element 4 transposase N-terminal
MYRLRQMDIDDKVCEQVDMALLRQVYPKEAIEACIGESALWKSKKRRTRQSTVIALVWFVIGMGLWSRLSHYLVWEKLIGKLSDIHPAEPHAQISDAGLSGRRKALGSAGLQELMRQCCVVLGTKTGMPSAFFGRYRLMAIDGTIFSTPDTPANAEAFGRSSNQYGPGAYPQVRGVLLVECASHGVVGLEISGSTISEIHGAHRLLERIGRDTLVLVDAGITAGGFFEHVRDQHAHVLGAVSAGMWEHLSQQRRLADGSVLAWVKPSRGVFYPMKKGMWVRIISYRLTDERLGEVGTVYRIATTLLNPQLAPADLLLNLYHERWEVELVIDEIKTHERAQRKVLRSQTPQGVIQELYGIFLAHYAVRAMMAQAAMQAQVDPDRLSFTRGLFQVVEMISFSLVLDPQSGVQLVRRLYDHLTQELLPPRFLRINRREIKQIYCKYPPKKRSMPPPEPFEPGDQFLDFVEILDPLALPIPQPVVK